jgi:hypothetical protein
MELKLKDHEGDDVIGKTIGMSADQLADLPYPDYRKITQAFWECVRDPLKDGDEEKNSLSESTSA